MSDIVYSLIDKGFIFSSSHCSRAKLCVSVADKMGRIMASRSLWVLGEHKENTAEGICCFLGKDSSDNRFEVE